MSLTPQEFRTALVIASIQFINIMDFMVIMPLAPDFVDSLGMPASHIGYVASAYTGAAFVSGLICSLFLDRLPRRKALAVCLFGLLCATILCAFAVDMTTMIGARILAGSFGGPGSAVGMAVIADRIAESRRGKAMGIVMGAISAAAIIGVPAGLEISRLLGWRATFLCVAALGGVVAILALTLLPPTTQASTRPNRAGAPEHTDLGPARLRQLFTYRTVWLSYGLMVCAMAQLFLIVPNIAAFAQFNLNFPREQLGLLYLVGGLCSLVGMQIAGRLVDRIGATPVTLATTAGICLVLWIGFVDASADLSILVFFPALMIFNTARGVANQATFLHVPPPELRAGFLSILASIKHAGVVIGTLLSAMILETASDNRLLHTDRLALTAMGLSLLAPVLMILLEGALGRRHGQAPAHPHLGPKGSGPDKHRPSTIEPAE